MTEAQVEPTEDVPNVEEPDNTELELWTWGLSGQPSSWALPTWTDVIDAIRQANRGEIDVATVQDLIDAAFPGKGYSAANIVLAHPPVGEFTATVTDMSVRVDLAGDQDLLLPDENVQWDFGDGTLVNDAGGWDHEYAEPGSYAIELHVAVGGSLYGSGERVEVPSEFVPPDPPVEPGLAERSATISYDAAEAQEAEEVRQADQAEAEQAVEETFDPGQHTIDEVMAYVEAYPDSTEQVLDDELGGKNRVTLVDKLEALLDAGA